MKFATVLPLPLQTYEQLQRSLEEAAARGDRERVTAVREELNKFKTAR